MSAPDPIRCPERLMSEEILDDFRDVSGWSAVVSGQAQLVLRRDTGPSDGALTLDYDFKGGGGFVVARKRFARRLPESWAIDVQIRGAAPANTLEIKLADPTGRDVWWWHRDAFEFPDVWQPLRIRSSEVSFAWGPAGGGAMRELGAIEVAIAAGPGGRGTVSLADLRFEDLSLTGPPRVQASSAAPGREPAGALDASPATSWRTASDATPQWIALDFGREHEYGGLVIDWEPHAEARAFDVQGSADGVGWTTLWSARQAEGERSYVYLAGGGRSRHLRLHLLEAAAGAEGFGIRRIDVRPFDFARSLADFFHAVAAAEPRGHSPRWLHREQSYWTPVGVAGAQCGPAERGGHARARSRLVLARAVPVHGRRAGDVGGRRGHDLAGTELPADPVVDVAVSRARPHDDGLRRRGSRRSGRPCLLPRRRTSGPRPGACDSSSRCAHSR